MRNETEDDEINPECEAVACDAEMYCRHCHMQWRIHDINIPQCGKNEIKEHIKNQIRRLAKLNSAR